MDRDRANGIVKHFECIKAFANGARIEYRVNDSSEWVVATSPMFEEYYEYRVAPPPLEMWVVVDNKGKLKFGCYTEDVADGSLVNITKNFPDGAPYKKVRLTEAGK